ncbi:MAG: phasin family protein [Bacteroidales bacterium]|nr:phasin family protein [Bacteroidales bacterium]
MEENKDNVDGLIKKLIYQGIGIAAMTKEKLEQAVSDLIHSNKISAEEGKKIVDDFSQNVDSKAKDTEKKIRDIVNETISKFRPATKSEVEDLKKRIEALEKMIASLD